MLIAATIDAISGRVPLSDFVNSARQGTMTTTPAIFIANNLSLVVLVPAAMLISWSVTGQRPRWLSSVAGGIRWRWLGLCLAMTAPLWVALMVVQYFGSGGPAANPLHVTGDTLPLLLAVIFTTPLQSAGEEYTFRGVINRSVASWIPHEVWGAVAGGLVSSTLFMLAHGAGDPWLNLFYFCFGSIATFLTWRTGGLEASIALHVINNVTSEWTLPFVNISGMFDRQAGTAGPGVLFQLALPVIALVLIVWQARRRGVVRRSTPELGPAAAPRGAADASALARDAGRGAGGMGPPAVAATLARPLAARVGPAVRAVPPGHRPRRHSDTARRLRGSESGGALRTLAQP